MGNIRIREPGAETDQKVVQLLRPSISCRFHKCNQSVDYSLMRCTLHTQLVAGYLAQLLQPAKPALPTAYGGGMCSLGLISYQMAKTKTQR
jgi:hypothetical protein